jgi:hypothetical protein
MRNLHLLSFLFFLQIVSFRAKAQKEDNVWFLGGSSASDSVYKTCMFDFTGDTLTRSYLYQNLPFRITNTSISDAAGNLLCFSNGENIYNRNRQVMENGFDFFPKSNGNQYTFSQSYLLLPLPNDAQKVVYIYGDPDFVNDLTFIGYIALKYAIVDMSLNGGLGSVVQRELVAGTDTTAVGQITAVRHGNGRDWWVLAPRFEPNVYYRFLLTPDGLHAAGAQIIPSAPVGLGQVVFSPDGQWYGRYNWHGIIPDSSFSTFDLYRFDRCTGLLGEHTTKTYSTDGTKGKSGGIAFSNSSRYLYVSRWDSIFQYDLHATDILASEEVVAVYDGFLAEFNQPTRFFTLQLAPDNKIYCSVSNVNSRYLHVIENPDLPGVACNVRQHAIHLPVFNNNLLPNMPYYRLYDEDGSPCDTLGINGPPTSVRPLVHSPHLRLYPNPAQGWIVLDSEKAPTQPLWLRFYNAQGRIVLEMRHPEFGRSYRFGVETLQPGYYVLEIVCDGGVRYMEKVVVVK